ncbi:hypothetical protein N9L47_00410 [Rhodobacteraceae bacterium]|nr:hypothetical protein [Paracoccaceae bacterium]
MTSDALQRELRNRAVAIRIIVIAKEDRHRAGFGKALLLHSVTIETRYCTHNKPCPPKPDRLATMPRLFAQVGDRTFEARSPSAN